MPDHLESALRRYELIRPTRSGVSARLKAEELSDWLDRDVCPIVQELLERPGFQMWAKWPMDRLVGASHRRERALVDSVDHGLVIAAGALARFARLPAVYDSLTRLEAVEAAAVNSGEIVDGTGAARAAAATVAADEVIPAVPSGLSTMEFIADRPWHDLVAIGDYFGPVNDLNLRDREAFLGPDSRHVQIAEFLPYCRPRLRPLGDYVTRTLLIRIEYWQNMVQRFWVRCQPIGDENPREHREEWSQAVAATARLSQSVDELKHVLMTDPDLKLREACLTLVQLYAGYRSHAKFSWLGPVGKLAGNASRVRFEVERRQNLAIAEQIAGALAEVAELYRGPEDSVDIIQRACARHALVLVAGPGRREAFWKGQLVEVDWMKRETQWRFLVALVGQLKRGLGADRFNAECSMKDARHRLKPLIPEELDEKIVSAGKGTYKLTMPPDDAALFQCEEEERFAAIEQRTR